MTGPAREFSVPWRSESSRCANVARLTPAASMRPAMMTRRGVAGAGLVSGSPGTALPRRKATRIPLSSRSRTAKSLAAEDITPKNHSRSLRVSDERHIPKSESVRSGAVSRFIAHPSAREGGGNCVSLGLGPSRCRARRIVTQSLAAPWVSRSAEDLALWLRRGLAETEGQIREKRLATCISGQPGASSIARIRFSAKFS